jgi:hypothetical protein
MPKNSNTKKCHNACKRVLCDVLLTESDLYLVNGLRNGYTSFAIQTLNEDIFNDELANNYENFRFTTNEKR